MKVKNLLTKLTAAVSCVAVLMSFTSSAFAFEFVDVADTSYYKTAFDELYALGVINGYEDGTIRPDDNITRAEVTKMVVAAMGPSYMEAAVGASGIDTEFSDVTGNHWAAGYISTGVANGFINGNGDGTFDPEANVTYAQIVKMLVCAMGYNAICERNGGWPNGYLTVAASIGVTSGVNVVGADTIVTRGQVALLMDNAIDIPIVDVTGYEESAITGQLIAKTEIMDEISGYNAKDYQTLLTKNHNAYKVKGRITATKRSEPSLKTGEVKFRVESTNNFDDIAYGSSYAAAAVERMKYSENDASSLMFVYGEALISVNSDGDYEILSFSPYGSNDSDTRDTSLFDTYTMSDGSVSSIDMYVSDDSSKTKKFKMSDDFKVYVNGVEQSDEKSALDDYLAGNYMGKVTFIDATDIGKTSTDGKCDYVLITYYADAVVDTYTESDDTLKIYFKDASSDMRGSLKADLSDDDISISFIYQNREFDYTDLKENDVLSIAYDVSGSFDDSDFYDIYVSRDVVDGRVNGTRTDSSGRTLYKINSEEYAMSSSMSSSSIEVGTTYSLYLNAFGKIVKFDESTANSLIGIVERVYKTSDTDEYSVKLITNTGSKVTYKAKDSAAYNRINSVFAAMSGRLEDRIVEYTINANGYITGIEKVKAVRAERVSYRESSNKIGSYSLSENTIVIDLTDSENNVDTKNGISSVSRKTVSSFTDDGEYDVVLAEKSSSDSTYRFVYVFGGSEVYTADTAIAVYDSSITVYDDMEGGRIEVINAYTDGMDDTPVQLKVSSSYKPNLKRGDVFVYATDSDGYIDEVIKLFGSIGSAGANYETFLSAVMSPDYKSRENCSLYASFLNMPDGWANTTSSTRTGKVDVIFAPIIDKNNRNVTLGRIDNNIQSSEANGQFDYSVLSNANIYVYDFSEKRETNRLSRGYVSSIQKTNIPNSCKLGSEREIVDWKLVDESGNGINFIFAKVVDGDIEEALVILGDKNSYSSGLVTRYSVTATNCIVSKSTAKAGEQITITPDAAPDNKELDGVYVNGTKLADNTLQFTMPAQDTTVEVRFKDIAYNVSISNAEDIQLLNQSTQYMPGDTVTLTAAEKPGYTAKVIVTTADGELTTTCSGNTYTFTMPSKSVNVSANYVAIEYKINITGGYVTNEENVPVSTAPVGTKLIIVPDAGKTPSSVKLNDSEYSEMTLTMPASDVTIAVEYPAEPQVFSISAVDCVTSLTLAKAGDIISVSYVEPENKVIEKITVNDLPIEGNEFVMPASDVTVIAKYIDPLYSLTAKNCTLSAASAKANDVIVVSYNPPTGLSLEKILVNGTAISGNTFVMPAANTEVEAVFVKNTYSLTAIGCTLSASEAKYGDVIKVSCTVPTGMVIDKITVNDLPISNNEFTMPACDAVVKATFTEEIYEISGVDCIASKSAAKPGDIITVSYAVPDGKELEKITVNNQAITGNSFTMPGCDVTVKATFIDSKTYTITATGCKTDKLSAKAGELVTVTYTVPNGKVLDKILVNGSAISGASFKMPAANITVSVQFKDMTYAITAKNCKTDKTVAAAGEKVTVTYTEPEGMVLDKITLNGTAISGTFFGMPAMNALVEAIFKTK